MLWDQLQLRNVAAFDRAVAVDADTAAPGQLELTLFEEAILAIEPSLGPWTIQLEVGCERRLDAERLGAAITTACVRHPLAAARLLPAEPRARSRRWQIGMPPGDAVLAVADCPDGPALSRLRGELYGAPPALHRGPPLRAILARGPRDDAVLFALSHVAFDGIGALAFVRAVACAYRGDIERAAPVALGRARDLERELLGRSPLNAGTAREAGRRLREALRPPARVATDGAVTRAGEGVVVRELDRDRTRALLASRPRGASVNDVALAAAIDAADRWNARHGARGDRISVTMPVNMRPRAWFWDVVGNYASFLPVSARRAERGRPGGTLAAVMAQTEPRRRRARTEGLLGLLGLLRPAGRRRAARRTRPRARPVHGFARALRSRGAARPTELRRRRSRPRHLLAAGTDADGRRDRPGHERWRPADRHAPQ